MLKHSTIGSLGALRLGMSTRLGARTGPGTRPGLFGLGALALVVLSACSAPPGLGGDEDSDGGDGDGGDGVVIGPDGVLPDGTEAQAVLPARIRRLTNAEYDASVQALLGTAQAPSITFPPDTRQHGYTLNEAQRVDPVLARQLDTAAQALSAEAVLNLESLAPCADPLTSGETCATAFIESFGARAYRRPLIPEELSGLLTLYQVAAEGATYEDGIAQVLRGLLQSPGFLYVTEIGDGTVTGTVSLTPYELASAISYLLTGAPPDDALAALAASGEILNKEVRTSEALRLFQSEQGQARAVRFAREWLGVDRILVTAKDAQVYPAYEALRDAMANETRDFVLASLVSSGGNVSELLGAPWTVVSPELGAMYGVSGGGRVDVPSRPGLLNQAAFLSVYAHAHETAPVLRGTAVLRRLVCLDLELPTDLDVEIIPPVPDPTLTTRERFTIHAADPDCARCHDAIDPLGFSFEQFDGMGQFRTTENSKPVDAATVVDFSMDFDGAYGSSTELAPALADSAEVRECLARQIFRAGAGEGLGAEESEEAFVETWSKLPAEVQGNLLELSVTFAASDLMTYRKEQ